MEDHVDQVQVWFHEPGDEICAQANHASHYQKSVLRVAVAAESPGDAFDAVVMMIPLDTKPTNGAVIRLTPEAAMSVAFSLMARAWLVRRRTPATDE